MYTKQIQRFESREEAGRKLAERLPQYSKTRSVIVLALPKGGVPVGAEIARLLNKPFDVLFVGKITAPGCGGMPLGAITTGGVRMLNNAMIDRLHLSKDEVRNAVLQGALRLTRREKLCRGPYPPLATIADHTVILVDDGSTPCAVVRDAIRLLRRQHAERVIMALPSTCHHDACDLRLEADEVITLVEPPNPRDTGKSFKSFPLTTTADVRRILAGKCPIAGAGN